MSQESAKLCVKKLESDPELSKRIKQAKNEKEVQSILKESGFNFTEKEFKEAWKALKGMELSENDLMKICGGRHKHVLVRTE